MVKIMIPHFTRILKTETLEKATRIHTINEPHDVDAHVAQVDAHVAQIKRREDLFLYILNHISSTLVTDKIVEALVADGSLRILKIVLQRFKSYCKMTQRAWDIAFVNNHADILAAFPEFTISETLLVSVCRAGNWRAIESLAEDRKLNDKCLVAAIRSGSAKLIHMVTKKCVNPKFTHAMLMDSVGAKLIEYGDVIEKTEVDPVLAVFFLGNFDVIDDQLKLKLVQYGQYQTLEFFHNAGLDIYSQSVFEKAATCCSVPIIEQMLRNKKWSEPVLEKVQRLVYVSSGRKPSKKRVFDMIGDCRKGNEIRVDNKFRKESEFRTENELCSDGYLGTFDESAFLERVHDSEDQESE